jgi:hypothetical protein
MDQRRALRMICSTTAGNSLGFDPRSLPGQPPGVNLLGISEAAGEVGLPRCGAAFL